MNSSDREPSGARLRTLSMPIWRGKRSEMEFFLQSGKVQQLRGIWRRKALAAALPRGRCRTVHGHGGRAFSVSIQGVRANPARPSGKRALARRLHASRQDCRQAAIPLRPADPWPPAGEAPDAGLVPRICKAAARRAGPDAEVAAPQSIPTRHSGLSMAFAPFSSLGGPP